MTGSRSKRHAEPADFSRSHFDEAATEALGQELGRYVAGSQPEHGNGATPMALAHRVREAVAGLAGVASEVGLSPKDLEGIEQRQTELLRGSVEALLDRIEAGRIRHLPDGIRWSRTLQDSMGKLQLPAAPTAPRDVAEVLARLCVDLTARHAGQQAELLLAAFALAADDYGLFRVIDFYERHQACRLALETTRKPRNEGPDARSFGLAAVASGARALLPRIVIATTGPVASGKSTIAHALALRIGAPRVVADTVRDVLLDIPSDPRGPEREREIHEALWRRAFEPDFEDRVYRAVLNRADDVLSSGRPVVLDACMPTCARRREVGELAAAHRAPLWFVECQPSQAVLRNRLTERNIRDGCNSPAWETIAGHLTERWEPWSSAEPGHHLLLDTGQPVEQCLEATRTAIPGWPDRFPD
ncbi:MAG: AAA family ATPase [bacterium]|nr:AAA family ATPase [bacterium]